MVRCYLQFREDKQFSDKVLEMLDLQDFLPEEKKWVTLRVSTNAMRTINKIGLAEALKRAKAKGYYKP